MFLFGLLPDPLLLDDLGDLAVDADESLLPLDHAGLDLRPLVLHVAADGQFFPLVLVDLLEQRIEGRGALTEIVDQFLVLPGKLGDDADAIDQVFDPARQKQHLQELIATPGLVHPDETILELCSLRS